MNLPQKEILMKLFRNLLTARRVEAEIFTLKQNVRAGSVHRGPKEEAPDVLTSLKTPFRRLAAMNLPLLGRRETVPSIDGIMNTVKEMVK